MAKNKKAKDYGTGIPEHAIDSLARCFLPDIQRFFESEEGKREFEVWKAEQEEHNLIEDERN